MSRKGDEDGEKPILVVAEDESRAVCRFFAEEGKRVEFLSPAGFLDPQTLGEADLVLLDCGFHPDQGLDLRRRIKALHPGVPVVFLADDGSEGLALKVFRAGAREYFGKPVDLLALKETCTNLPGMKRACREKRVPLLSWEEVGAVTVPSDLPAGLLRAVQYMEENLAGEIHLDFLARTARLSRFHFCRLFRKHVGTSPLRFLAFPRLARAKSLLRRADLTISAVALKAGFQDFGAFTRLFKKHTGMTPRAFRASLRTE